MTKTNTIGRGLSSAVLGMALTGGAGIRADEARIRTLEAQVQALAQEVEQIKLEEAGATMEGSIHGLSPSASKVYHTRQGVSIGGYGEALFQHFEDPAKSDEWDFLRAVLYTGYKYNDRLILNTELELEHASTDQKGYASLEFAYLDYLYQPALNFRAGLVLVPVGLLSELHEPTTFLSARRTDTETRIIPSTWRENGAGVFGDVAGFSYKLYVLNGMNGSKFSAEGLRGGRQKASKANAEDLAVVGRLDYTAVPGFVIGGSVYSGDSGDAADLSAPTTLYEGHVDLKWRGWEFRALGTVAEVDGADGLSTRLAGLPETVPPPPAGPVAERLTGWYVQAGFDVLSILRSGEAALIPFVRYEEVDTQDRIPSGFAALEKFDTKATTVGVCYKPIDQVTVKVDYQFYDNASGTAYDQANVALGYIF